MRTLFLAALLALASAAALAQEPPPPTPMEMQQKTITALQAMLDLREAQLKTVAATAQKRDGEWAEYAKPLWQAKK